MDTFRAFAGYWGYEAEPYDALMSFYEPGTTVQQMDRLADELKHFVIDLFQTLQARGMPCGEPAEGRFRSRWRNSGPSRNMYWRQSDLILHQAVWTRDLIQQPWQLHRAMSE